MYDQEPAGEGLQTETFEYVVHTRAGRFFWHITAWPKTILVVCVVFIVVLALCMTRLTKDTSAEAFISSDHPAIVYKDHVEEVFGLSDPVIVALVNEGPHGVFNPRSLNLVNTLTNEIRKLPGIDPDRVTSLTTENNILGNEYGMEVTPLLDDQIETQAQADAVREAAMHMPVYTGTLVAADGTATLIVAELLDPEKGNDVWHAVMDMSHAMPRGEDELYVAGEGAVAEHLGEYVDTDAQRLYPIIALVIMCILFVAYRSPRGIALPMLVVAGALVTSLGAMAAAGVPYYIITSALPVIIIAIGVADGIHIIGDYYEELSIRPHASQRELVVRAVSELWHPVFFTSMTDAAGFFALAAASFMPPMRAFGVFAGVGVAASCAFSLLMIPSLLMLLKPRPSRAFKRRESKTDGEVPDIFGRFMALVGRFVMWRPAYIIALALVLAVTGAVGAMQLEVNYRRIDYFHPDEEIYRADMAINERFDGTNFIDIVVETPETEGLLAPGVFAAMDGLETYAKALPHVGGTSSILDYLKTMNRALNEDQESHYALPEDSNLLAQYLLLYSATGDPDDLEEEIDYDYRIANIRLAMTSGLYTDNKFVMESLQDYIDEHFAESDTKVTLSGRGAVTYYWVKDLANSHFAGVIASLSVVWLLSAYSLRSVVAGLFAIAPVCLSILSIYAFMGFFNIWLGVGTSMFAAIGIGISVNFAIHTLDRTIELVRDYGDNLTHALKYLFPSTGRALLFNFAAVFFGFGVLMTSQVPPLNAFGVLVAVAVFISFIASITLLPAMLILFNPGFLRKRSRAVELETANATLENW